MIFALSVLGMVFVVEGLAFALAPARFEQILEIVRRIPVETRRMIGLGVVAFGVALIWLARSVLG